jgi:hypothetical protein
VPPKPAVPRLSGPGTGHLVVKSAQMHPPAAGPDVYSTCMACLGDITDISVLALDSLCHHWKTARCRKVELCCYTCCGCSSAPAASSTCPSTQGQPALTQQGETPARPSSTSSSRPAG